MEMIQYIRGDGNKNSWLLVCVMKEYIASLTNMHNIMVIIYNLS